MNFLIYPDNGLWFLWILFWNFCCLKCVFYVKNFGVKNLYAIFLIMILVLLLPSFNGGIKLLKTYFPFFMCGYLIHEYNNLFVEKLLKLKYYSLIIFPLLASLFYRTTQPQEWFVSNYILVTTHSFMFSYLALILYKVLVSLTGIFLIYTLVKLSSNSRWNKVFSFLGLYTLEIYCVHMLVFSMVPLLVGYFELLFFVVLIIMVSIIIAILLKRINILKFLLFGR